MRSLEDYYEAGKRHRETMEKYKKELEETNQKNGNETNGQKANQDNFHGDCDSVYSLENVPATILYIIVMVGSLIFNDFWIIWIVASIIFFNFITRHDK